MVERKKINPGFLMGLKPVPGEVVSAVGGVTTFTSPNAGKVVASRIALRPVQTGAGVPSPSNIRPIIGTDSVTIKNNDTTLVTVNFPHTLYRATYYPEEGRVLIRGAFLTFTGATGEDWTTFGTGSNKLYRYILPNRKMGTATDRLCSHYRNVAVTSDNTNTNAFYAYTQSSGTSILIQIRPDLTEYDTLTKFKAFLAAQLENNTPVQVYVPFAEASNYSIDDFVNPILLHTVKGENIFSVETDNGAGTMGQVEYSGGLAIANPIALINLTCGYKGG